MDPILSEAILRTLRVLTMITGSLVLVDSVGILVMPREAPPHKPKWAALSWCIVAASAAIATAYLLSTKQGLVAPSEQGIIWFLYAGLTTGFTCRAVSRAHRPWFTIFAVLGLSLAGIVFALRDLAG